MKHYVSQFQGLDPEDFHVLQQWGWIENYETTHQTGEFHFNDVDLWEAHEVITACLDEVSVSPNIDFDKPRISRKKVTS